MTAPVLKDERLELRIDSLAYGGKGVARLEGFVLFVQGGLPGDLVRARVAKVKSSYAEAELEQVLEPSPSRVEAPCAHFGACGGCRFQNLAYEAQCREKAAQVRDALVRIGGIVEPPLDPIVPSEQIYGYRNKLEYSFASTPEGAALGFHRAGRWDEVLPIERCLLTSELGNEIRWAVEEWAGEEMLEVYDQKEQRGYLRHLVVREGRNTGQALVLLVTASSKPFDRAFLIRSLTKIPQLRSIHWAVNESDGETTNIPARLVWGEEAIEEELCGLRFRLRPNAFLQTNTSMAERLYELVGDCSGLTGKEIVWDLYCGTGTIGISLARHAKSVWGIEISEESVACALENAERNGIENASFFAGNVGQAMRELADRSGRPDVVVVDPPRAGLAGKALKRLAEIAASRIVYISCNPTTLAGDLRQLAGQAGYRLVRARPLDMFPHTPHVETVALLER